jgi:predicted metal-binding membrane protein
LASLAERLAAASPWLLDNGGRIGGAVLILAGLYQLSPLKTTCLSKCRTPTSFVLTSWKEGRSGALRMGFEHGVYCLGCCWLLFVILFPLGMMNIAALAAVALLIFAEKTLAVGRVMARVAAVALIGYGIVVILMPGVLPRITL